MTDPRDPSRGDGHLRADELRSDGSDHCFDHGFEDEFGPHDLEHDHFEHDDLEHDDLEHDDLEHDDLEHDDLEHHHLDGFGEDVPQTRAEARELEREQGGRRRRRGRGALVLLVTLALVAGAGWAAVTYLKPLLSFSSESSDYPGPGSGAVTITVKDGDTASAIGETLAQAGVVKTARAFAQAAAASPRGNSIQPGTYAMMSQMTAAAALAILIDPANRGGIPRVTIREGLWSSETFAALAKASGLPVSDYVAAAKNTAALGLPAAAKGRLEGYLFPATYEFPQGSSAADQLTMMVAKAVQELSALGISDTTMERTVIIASIVEAEGRIGTDRPKIARVIENRLAVPMRLQLDSTVSYGIQKRAITTSDAERADPNPFNTYAHDGLPVGPIGNPGLASLRAAINPTPGPWLYFVAVNPTTGETKFATTAAEHAVNVAQFQQWCSANPGTC